MTDTIHGAHSGRKSAMQGWLTQGEMKSIPNSLYYTHVFYSRGNAVKVGWPALEVISKPLVNEASRFVTPAKNEARRFVYEVLK